MNGPDLRYVGGLPQPRAASVEGAWPDSPSVPLSQPVAPWTQSPAQTAASTDAMLDGMVGAIGLAVDNGSAQTPNAAAIVGSLKSVIDRAVGGG